MTDGSAAASTPFGVASIATRSVVSIPQTIEQAGLTVDVDTVIGWGMHGVVGRDGFRSRRLALFRIDGDYFVEVDHLIYFARKWSSES